MTHHGELAEYALTPEEEKFLCHSLIQIKKRLNSLPMKHNIDETLRRYRIGEAVWDKFPCYVAWFHTRIKVDGTVFPCGQCNLPLGSLLENSFREIWNGPAYRIFRRQALTRKGLASLSQHCHCEFCCFVEDNARVHGFFRWLSPFLLSAKQ
jgi:MoaA/NifB/PqqE/SkfB family radical SAM enzyme